MLREPGTHGQELEYEHLLRLCNRYSANPPAADASCYFNDFGEFEVRWEKHTKFSTYTVLRKETHETPFEHHALTFLPQNWLSSLPGKIIAVTHVTMEKPLSQTPTLDELHEKFEGQSMIAATMEGRVEIWTAFRLHSDGFGRYMLYCEKLNSCETGLLLQRILEVENYRLLALMSLPLARKASPVMARIENELAVVT